MALVLAIAAAASSVANPRLKQLVGKWAGTSDASPIPVGIEILVREEGSIFVIDITRRELLGEKRERVYVDGDEALVSANFAREPRRDKVAVIPYGAAFASEPWNIGSDKPLRFHWSIESGWYEPPIPARIYIHAPTYRPDAFRMTYKWSGSLGDQQLGENAVTLIRLQ